MRTYGTVARGTIELGTGSLDVAKSAFWRDAKTSRRDARATRNGRLHRRTARESPGDSPLSGSSLKIQDVVE